MTQLLGNGLKAEKTLKTAVEQLKKAAEKKQEKASKAKKANASPSIPIFDQGASMATQVEKLAAGAKVNASKPFLMDCSSVVSTLKEDGKLTQQQAASFKVTFDEDRKKAKGIRVSLRLEATDDKSVQEMTGAIYQIFEPVKALADLTTSPECLKPSLVASFFGVDAGYDKVSAESFGLATGRLCLEGTRCVVATEMMQLSGFMERKGIAGPIPAAKMTSFFKATNPAMLAEFTTECSLWTCTVSAGDFLYTPYGFLQAELVSQPTLGIRVPLICKESSHGNAVVAATKRMEEMDRLRGTTTNGEDRIKMPRS